MDMGALFIATNHLLGEDRMRISGRNTKNGENKDNVSPRPTVLHTLNRGSFTPANENANEDNVSPRPLLFCIHSTGAVSPLQTRIPMSRGSNPPRAPEWTICRLGARTFF